MVYVGYEINLQLRYFSDIVDVVVVTYAMSPTANLQSALNLDHLSRAVVRCGAVCVGNNIKIYLSAITSKHFILQIVISSN